MVSLNQLFEWFSTGKYPTEEQFAEQFKSFWHKSEKIPASAILNYDQLVEQIQLERRLTFTVQSEMYTMMIAEPMTIYRADYIGLDKLEISLDGGITWQTIGAGDNAVTINNRMLVTFRFTYSAMATEAYIYLFAKIKI